MRSLNMLAKIGAVGAILMVLPLASIAQGPPSGVGGAVSPPTIQFSFQTVVNLLNTVVTWIFTIFLIVSVIFIILAAFNYLTSGGDAEKVSKATRQVVFAAVAIAVALLSVAIRFVVEQLVGAPPQ